MNNKKLREIFGNEYIKKINRIYKIPARLTE